MPLSQNRMAPREEPLCYYNRAIQLKKSARGFDSLAVWNSTLSGPWRGISLLQEIDSGLA